MSKFGKSGAWGSLFKNEGYHCEIVREAAGRDGWRTCSDISNDLNTMAFFPGDPPAALREVECHFSASKFSFLKRDPHAPHQWEVLQNPNRLKLTENNHLVGRFSFDLNGLKYQVFQGIIDEFVKVGNHHFLSFRRKPESSLFNQLRRAGLRFSPE